MTFSRQVKEEIFAGKPLSGKERGFFSYGLLLCSTAYEENILKLNTESKESSKLYCYSIEGLLGVKIKPIRGLSLRGEEDYTVTLTEDEGLKKVHEYFKDYPRQMLEDDKGVVAFLSGAFMGCGTVNDPQKEYRLAFHPPTGESSDLLFILLSRLGYPPKTVERGNRFSLYYKESEQIEDLLNLLGATSSGFRLMETKIYKDVRNKSNRQSNCDNANIDKIVDAAQQQIKDIQVIVDAGKMDLLTPSLKEMAMIRLEHPDASLRELSELLGITRSGVNHRLKKLTEWAQRLDGEYTTQ